MEVIFWLLVALIIYAYCGYPLMLMGISRLKTGNTVKSAIEPFVTVIIAAHNEEKTIRRKVAGTLGLDYPADKVEVIVVSDGSTDATAVEAGACGDPRVRVIPLAGRRGKTHAQNVAVASAAGEIVVFSDATTEYDPGALRALVRSFADPRVGAVGGELEYVNPSGSAAGDGGGFYWRYERFIKKLESAVCSLIGVSGCCYAVRRELYEDIPEDIISDFVIAQIMYGKGRRTVYEPGAVSYEAVNDNFSDEFSMRVRVAVRTLHGLWRMRRLMNPFRYGFFSLEIISHKVLRYLIPVFLAAALAVNSALLYGEGARLFFLTLVFQLSFYCAVAAGWILRGKRYVNIPYYFFITNAALFVGFLRFLRGEKQVVWNPVRK